MKEHRFSPALIQQRTQLERRATAILRKADRRPPLRPLKPQKPETAMEAAFQKALQRLHAKEGEQ